MAQISTDMFFYDKQERCFSQEMSTLSGGKENRPVLERLYPDSCDEGIQLISHKTLQTITFYVDRTHINRDNEITHWELFVTPECLRKLPHLKGVKVIIWND